MRERIYDGLPPQEVRQVLFPEVECEPGRHCCAHGSGPYTCCKCGAAFEPVDQPPKTPFEFTLAEAIEAVEQVLTLDPAVTGLTPRQKAAMRVLVVVAEQLMKLPPPAPRMLEQPALPHEAEIFEWAKKRDQETKR